MSNTCKRGKRVNAEGHSLFETISATIAVKVMRRHRMSIYDAMNIGRFLAVFVIVFTAPYSLYKRLKVSAKIRHKSKELK